MVYRQDVGMKYESFGIARRFAERQDERAKKQVGRKPQKQVALPGSAEELLLFNAVDRLQVRGGDFGMITMPLQTNGEIQLTVATVEEALHGHTGVEQPAVGSRDRQYLSKKRKHLSELAAAVSKANIRDELPPQHCCFGVMQGNPTKGKSISTFVYHGGPVLRQSDFAVPMHHFFPAPAQAPSLWICVLELSLLALPRGW